ncbi:MAG TPA: peptide deformylase [Candidatus Saccharimonadales bacterium]
MKKLKRTQFGNPILRQKTAKLSSEQIKSEDVQNFIKDIQNTLSTKDYGIGLAAPQVGRSISLAVIALKPTPTRPDNKELKMVIINPEIISTDSTEVGMWEACISGSDIYGKAMRHENIRLKWHDETGKLHEQEFSGIVAQVIQHEVDHLNGVLFVDRVIDTKTYITFAEYKKLQKIKNKQI